MTTLPRFGFELTSVDYDASRMLNPMSRITNTKDNNHRYMFNRVPYNFSFGLYLATRKFEDSLKIVEQIMPFFTPDLNITIKDKEDFNIYTDIPIVLNNSSFMIDYMGDFENRRTIQWSFAFTAKACLYSNIREQTRIKESIIKMSDYDFNCVYETFMSEVIPRSANKEDPHTIVNTITEGPPSIRLSGSALTGESFNLITEDSNTITLPMKPIETGSSSKIVPFPGSL